MFDFDDAEEQFNNPTGSYIIVLLPGKTYHFTIRAPGYEDLSVFPHGAPGDTLDIEMTERHLNDVDWGLRQTPVPVEATTLSGIKALFESE